MGLEPHIRSVYGIRVLRAITLANPQNRYSREHREYDPEETPEVSLELFEDQSKSILAENRSPDLGFTYSVNPYRGCAHGCAYCYARPSHEKLGFGSGTDFERRLVIKKNAAALLRESFERPSWKGELVIFSGNTDCYQPLEAKLELTRRCLEVCAEYRNPIHVITKSTLVERDIDLLTELHRVSSAAVSVSVPFWDPEVARAIEPYAPAPARRIETIRRLSRAGLAVVVHVAPLIPGLSDSDLIPVLEAARQAGAVSAVAILLRLPGSVPEVFEARLRQALPLRADKVLRRIKEARGGNLNDPRFFSRMRGEGTYAKTLFQIFEKTRQRLGYEKLPEARAGTFARPMRKGSQLPLFG